jgi:hypothetical protein
MSTPLDGMSDDELREIILQLEEEIKLYEMAYKIMETALILECFKWYRKDKKARKGFRRKG